MHINEALSERFTVVECFLSHSAYACRGLLSQFQHVLRGVLAELHRGNQSLLQVVETEVDVFKFGLVFFDGRILFLDGIFNLLEFQLRIPANGSDENLW